MILGLLGGSDYIIYIYVTCVYTCLSGYTEGTHMMCVHTNSPCITYMFLGDRYNASKQCSWWDYGCQLVQGLSCWPPALPEAPLGNLVERSAIHGVAPDPVAVLYAAGLRATYGYMGGEGIRRIGDRSEGLRSSNSP